ncbi:hypothetical protein Tco_1549891 [Tanacetum coccineum]
MEHWVDLTSTWELQFLPQHFPNANKQDNKEAGQDSDPSHPPGFTQEVNVGVSVNQPVHSDISPNIWGSQNVSG